MSDFDVVVVGGGAAGLSGAVALARSCRSVLVVDAGDPRNAPAAHVHNVFTRDGASPAELLAAGRDEVRRYGGSVVRGRVSRIARAGEHFTVSYDERTVTARRLLVTTGLRDVLPPVPGLAERWGIDVLHCPYCHGYEARGRRVGVLSTGPMAVHQALLFRQLTDDVTVLTHTGPAPDEEQAEQLAARGVRLASGEVVGLEVVDDGLSGGQLSGGRLGGGRLAGARLHDGRVVPLDVLVVAPVMTARAELLADLGLRPVEVRMGEHVIGSRVEAEPTGSTAVPGVWVAGNVADVQAQVVTSAAAGLSAGAQINADLVAEDTRWAVEDLRAGRVFGEAAWEHRYRSHEQHWSGAPNAVLVTEASGLPAGSALDAGAGEGADARWLAARGWRVTAVDVSATALQRGHAAAEADGVDVEWRQADLSREPVDGTYDLVTAHYLHLPPDARREAFARLAAAVAPGGTLLVVGHDLSDLGTAVPRPALAEMGWTAADLAAGLGPGWTVEVAEARPRTVTGPDGTPGTVVHDAVLRARKDRAGNAAEPAETGR